MVGPYDQSRSSHLWTQQSLECRKRGDFIYVPTSALNNSEIEVQTEMFQQWSRFMYGLFDDNVMAFNVTSGSRQDSFCNGSPPFSIISKALQLRHPKSIRQIANPDFVISREISSKYVIVLENSVAMNLNNTWELLRTALRKFIKEDLKDPNTQVGLVLFNEAATIEKTVSPIGQKNSRQREEIDVKIKSRFELSPKLQSCVRCGVIKAIEALQTSGSTVGANVILISQGQLSVISRDDEKYLLKLSQKHKLRLFNLPLVSAKNNVSILFESLSHETNANSFLIETQLKPLDIYMQITNGLREIQRRSEPHAPVLLHEQIISEDNLSVEASGEFVIDENVANQTEFRVFTMGSSADNGFVKNIFLRDIRHDKYSDISNRLEYHYLSVFQVPFDDKVRHFQV